jgi:hypothetical protein
VFFAHRFISGEAERILKCKGRVFALEDEPEVARVWLPYDDAPGLAMARAFGDFCLKDYGLIAVPDVTHRKVVPEDEFIVLATDGVSSFEGMYNHSFDSRTYHNLPNITVVQRLIDIYTVCYTYHLT